MFPGCEISAEHDKRYAVNRGRPESFHAEGTPAGKHYSCLPTFLTSFHLDKLNAEQIDDFFAFPAVISSTYRQSSHIRAVISHASHSRPNAFVVLRSETPNYGAVVTYS